MELMRKVLENIQNGETSFKPTDDSHEALRDFQPLARRIVSAHKRGFLTRAIFSRNYEYGCDYIDCVMVGGLTFEGEQFLESQQKEPEKPAPVDTNKPADLIKFEPKLFGIKLEGNELYRRLKSWWKNKVKNKRTSVKLVDN